MTDTDSGFKVSDRRLFTEDGQFRDEETNPSNNPEASTGPPSSLQDSPDHSAEPELPMDFKTLVFSFSTSAMMQLGILPNPTTGKTERDLNGAKQTIDFLGILSEKTRGNLDSEEAQLLEASLHDLKMSYLRATNKITL